MSTPSCDVPFAQGNPTHSCPGPWRLGLFFFCCFLPERGGALMASKIEIKQRETGTLLGYFYTPLEPDDIRQQLTAQGMRAFAEDVGIYLPEINDPHETPFYD